MVSGAAGGPLGGAVPMGRLPTHSLPLQTSSIDAKSLATSGTVLICVAYQRFTVRIGRLPGTAVTVKTIFSPSTRIVAVGVSGGAAAPSNAYRNQARTSETTARRVS